MDYRQCYWRVGRSVGRTVYAVVSPTHDVLIGVLDSPLLAADTVYAHNVVLEVKKGTPVRLTPEQEKERIERLHISLQAEAEGEAVGP